jgi:RHS repeat-associated protein
MDAWHRTSAPWSAISKVSDFEENVAYDPNGNIQKYFRNGNNTFAGKPLAMDNLNYIYTSGTNQLDHITDSVSAPYPGYNDLTTQSAGNYQYDSVGELTADAASGITGITWTVYGKIASITKSSDTTLLFTYDAAGNRISKSVVYAGDTLTTWYVRDAKGSVMSVYTYGDPSINGKDLTQVELHIYGSSRLGIWKRSVDVAINTPTTTNYLDSIGTADSITFIRGNKLFELTNHLDNVLSTISDKRYGVSTDDTTIKYFNPEVVSANDYYPFGSLEPYRGYSENNSVDYRYGFNGKEKDDEVKGTGNQIDYGARIYDPRIGKFFSIDPLIKLYPELSSYQFASNTPIQAVDLDGNERLTMTNVDAQKRTATITVQKTAQIVTGVLLPELRGLSSQAFSNSFDGQTVYVRNLPENGHPVEFITKRMYRKRNIGYALNVQFNVSLVYVNPNAQPQNGPEYSTIQMGLPNDFNNPKAFARGTPDGSNVVTVNPNYLFFAINAANNHDGESTDTKYEELLAHEVGFHNMMGLLHQPDAQGQPIYPAYTTLESNQHGQIHATVDNVKQLLTMNIFVRGNLAPAAPAAPAAPVAPAPAPKPAGANDPDIPSPDYQKGAAY